MSRRKQLRKAFRPLLTGKVFHWLKHWRTALTLIALAVFLVTMVSLIFGMGPFQSVDGTEPAFLDGIGPQEQRSDNPLAAVVVMVSVIVVIGRGIRVHDRQSSVDGEE